MNLLHKLEDLEGVGEVVLWKCFNFKLYFFI